MPKTSKPKKQEKFFLRSKTCGPKKIKTYNYSTLASPITGTVLLALPLTPLTSTSVLATTALAGSASVVSISFLICSISNEEKFKLGWCLTRYF